MRILVLSDMHTEFWRNKAPVLPQIPANIDLVIAAGDIGVGVEGMHWVRGMFPESQIIYINGNHELYHHEYFDLKNEQTLLANQLNIHFLDPGTVTIDGRKFIGANLWTDFKLRGYRDLEPWDLQGFADFNVIRFNEDKMSLSTMRQIHQLEKQYIVSELEKGNNDKTVVITHFVPSQLCIAPKWVNNNCNPYFTNDLDDLFDCFKYPIHIYGHTHDRMDQVHPYGTRLIGNPLGYPKENPEQYEWKIIEV